MYFPFRSIIHDFFTNEEMDWLLKYSKPKLSAQRDISLSQSTQMLTNSKLNSGDKNKIGYSVGKAITAWFNDIEYNEPERYQRINKKESPVYEALPLQDPYSYTLRHHIMLDISKRIELATTFNVTSRHGSSKYQITNYGLSGMVVTHHDAWGYEQGVDLVEERQKLVTTGDYIATFMGWFQDTAAGGSTAFTASEFEGTITPTKGSAAFWMNLLSCHVKDDRAQHGGCPILKGSKWILNKWINSWDQWRLWPCDISPLQTIGPLKGMLL